MNGRNLIAGCGAALALAAVVRFAETSVPAFRGEQQVRDSESRTPAYPPAMGGPDLVHAVPTFAESRRKIVDSADLYAVVSKINVQSSTIDKLAASEALLACAEFRPRRKREQEEEAAAHELAARCAGIRQHMRRNDAIDKAVELRARAEEDPSLLGRLIALSRSSDAGKARWHAAEFALVGEALTSGDSVLISEAVRALHAQLDDGLPDAKLRSQAFAKAADSYLLHKADQRAIFDALVDCANLSRCDNESSHAEDTGGTGSMRQRSEIERLVGPYLLALQRGMPVQQLLTMR